jgi:Resolvase, N terminal domain
VSFDVVVVHSFSRFFRDHFELEFYVRKLAKNGVKLVSITQEMRNDPMHVMMRQIMTLFDEYQSKENATIVITMILWTLQPTARARRGRLTLETSGGQCDPRRMSTWRSKPYD